MPSNGVTPKATTALISDNFKDFTIGGKRIPPKVASSTPPRGHDEYSDTAGSDDMKVLQFLQNSHHLQGLPKPRGRG